MIMTCAYHIRDRTMAFEKILDVLYGSGFNEKEAEKEAKKMYNQIKKENPTSFPESYEEFISSI